MDDDREPARIAVLVHLEGPPVRRRDVMRPRHARSLCAVCSAAARVQPDEAAAGARHGVAAACF
jgi:hypothetical protein